MNYFQKRIKEFCVSREWGKFHNLKDLLLGIVEEVGEIRNVVKWEQDSEKLIEVMRDNKAKVKDDIGDIYWFLALLANSIDVDMDEAIGDVIKSNEVRFPIAEMKSKHTNIYFGEKDGQYSDFGGDKG